MNAQTDGNNRTAVAGPVERQVRPHVERSEKPMNWQTPVVHDCGEEPAAEAEGRNWYFEGQHGAEEPADIAARLELVQERDALRLMVTWAYGKLHSRTFNSMDDALELDRLKLWCEHGVVA